MATVTKTSGSTIDLPSGPGGISRGGLLRGKQDEKTYCLTGECSPDAERCLTARVPVASLISRPSHSSPFSILNQCLLMLALWSCGRRGSVVQAQRQIHRALRAAFTIAETIVRTIAEQASLAIPMRKVRIGRGGSEYHLVRSFSAPSFRRR